MMKGKIKPKEKEPEPEVPTLRKRPVQKDKVNNNQFVTIKNHLQSVGTENDRLIFVIGGGETA